MQSPQGMAGKLDEGHTKYLNKAQTATDLKEHIMQTMVEWFSLQDTQHHLDAQDIHDKQYKYDWICIFGRLLPAYWATTQAEFEEGQKYYPEEGGTAWAQALSQHFITHSFELWKTQNKLANQHLAHAVSNTHEQLSDKIRALWDQ